MRVGASGLAAYDGVVCFICGRYILNNRTRDLAYLHLPTGKSTKARPDKYYLFECPNCHKIAHKRCWYDVGERKEKKGWFGKTTWRLVCPSCGTEIAPARDTRTDWKHGYQIPGHPDEELPELVVNEVLAWKAGSVLGKVGQSIGTFFTAVGLGSLTDPEKSAIARAAIKVGRTLQDIAERVFRLSLPAESHVEIKQGTARGPILFEVKEVRQIQDDDYGRDPLPYHLLS